MLIVFPLGLLSISVIVDILYWFTHDARLPFVAFVLITGGLIGGLVAAIFGLRDWLAIPTNTRAKSVGASHGVGNVAVLALFALSWLVRRGNPDYVPTIVPLVLSVAGLLVAGFTGWLGGELVYRLGVGVDEGANLNAPNSLAGSPRTESQHEAQANIP